MFGPVLQTFWAIFTKERKQIFRNPFILRMMAVFQTIQIIMLAFIDINARDLPLVIVDQDQSSYSRELVEKVRATGTFDIRFVTSSVSIAREHVRAGRAKAALVIPPDFRRDRAKGSGARVLAMVDGSDSVASAQATTAIEGASATFNLDVERSDVPRESVTTHSVLLFNPEGKTAFFTLPALVAVVVANGYMTIVGMRIAMERGMGTLERLLMSPLSPTGYLLGKLATPFMMGVTNVGILLLIMRWLFGIPMRGNLIVLAVSFLIYLFATLGIGLFIGVRSMAPPHVNAQTMRLAVPFFFLSGYLFPLTSLPTWLLPLAYAMPVTHMIEIMRGVTLRGAGFTDLWAHMVYLALSAVFVISVAIRQFKASVG